MRQKVLVRVTVGVEAHTHEFIATAHEDQKFGFSLASGAALEAVRRDPRAAVARAGRPAQPHRLADLRHRRLRGRRAPRGRAARRRSATRVGLELPELDLGGGLGIAYTADDDPADVADVAKQLRAIVERECAAAALPVPRLAFEPGRAIVGPGAASTLYEVGTIKDVDHIRTYVSVDGGMSDNIRTALYGVGVHLRAGLAGRAMRRRCSRGSSASTARPATSSSATPGCPATWRRATCSPSPRPAPTVARWPAIPGTTSITSSPSTRTS